MIKIFMIIVSGRALISVPITDDISHIHKAQAMISFMYNSMNKRTANWLILFNNKGKVLTHLYIKKSICGDQYLGHDTK